MLERLAGRPVQKREIAAFVLMPQLKYSFRHLTSSYLLFVNIVAILFAQAGLISLNHPATRFQTVEYYTFRWLVGEAWHNLRSANKHDPYQWGLFLAVISMLGLVVLTAIILILKIGFGTAAQAQFFGHPTTPTSPLPPPAPFHPDIAQDVLNQVLRLGSADQGNLLQNALGDALSIYSNAIMVLAAFIVFWIIVSLVADTARTGELGGGKNMVWVPIRVVVALGLLVPFGSGFNSGQHIVLKLAEWGSNLGTNIWVGYVDSMVRSNALISAPPETDVVDAIGQFGEILVCRDAVNLQYLHYHDGAIPSHLVVAPAGYKRTNLAEYVDVNGAPLPNNTLQVSWGNTLYPKLCGSISFPHLDVTNTLDPQNLSGTGPDSIEEITRDLKRTVLNLWTPAASFGGGGGVTIQEQLDPVACRIAAAQFPFIDSGGPATTAGGCVNAPGVPAPSTPGALGWFHHIDPATGGKYPDTAAIISPILVNYMATVNAAVGNARTRLLNNLRGTGGPQMEVSQKTTGNSTSTPPPPSSTMVDEVANVGWGGMGIWYHAISQMNQNFLNAASVVPTFEGAQLPAPGNKINSVLSHVFTDSSVHGGAGKAVAAYKKWWSDGSYSNSGANEYHKQMGRSFTSSAAGIPDVGLTGGEEANSCWSKGRNPPISISGCLRAVDPLDLAGEGLYEALDMDGGTYPLAHLARLGNTMVNWSFSIFTAVAAIAAGASIATVGLANFALVILQSPVIGLIVTLGYALLGAGAMLLFYVPLIPFIRVLFAISGWILFVFEAVVAAPLFALAHLSTDGEGLQGSRAGAGYCFLLHILIRPAMVVFGFIGSLLIVDALVRVMNDTFLYAVLSVQGSTDGMGLLTWVAYLVVYTLVVYSIVNSTFKLIDVLPDEVMKWISCQGSGMPQDTGSEVGEFTIAAVNLAGNAARGFTEGYRGQQPGRGSNANLGGVGGGGGRGGAGPGGGQSQQQHNPIGQQAYRGLDEFWNDIDNT